MKRGTLIRQPNLDKKATANLYYMKVLVKMPSGKLETLIFTEKEVQVAQERTEKNPEDEIKPGFVDRLLRGLGKHPPLELPPGHSSK